MIRNSYSLMSGDPNRGAFVAYFLWAIVPLGGLGFMLGRYTALGVGGIGDLSIAPLKSAHALPIFFGISSLFLACFLLLQKLIRRSNSKIRQLTEFDTLTGLPNRGLFADRAEQTLLLARRDSALFALCFLDLDGFKRINETLGHKVGDELLCEVARRLDALVRLTDSITRLPANGPQTGIARLRGNEFTLLLSGISGVLDADLVARRMLKSLRASFCITDHEVFITASVGIAVYPFDGEDFETLLRNAETAMFSAKKAGPDNIRFFSAKMSADAKRKLQLEVRLRGAMLRNELSVHYQPVCEARSGHVVAAEALVRWEDAEIGSVSPEEFIPVAESAGLIDAIGEWVLHAACTQSRAWRMAGFKSIRMAVNVSGHQVRQPGLVEKVRQILQETALSAADLELEITESTIMQDDRLIDAAFNDLRDMGVALALDDFGTGYSSLTYLRRFPISRVKVDRSFIEGIPDNDENLAVTGAIIAMAHHLEISVVGEGVESEQQAQSLRDLGCEELQGYLYSRPVPASEFVRFLELEKQETDINPSTDMLET